MTHKVHRAANLVFLTLAAASLSHCRTRFLEPAQSASDPASEGSLAGYQDFCADRTGQSRPAGGGTRIEFLSPAEMEARISGWTELISASPGSPELKPVFKVDPGTLPGGRRASSILTAYASAYRDMIKIRDEARCAPNSPMWAGDPLVRQINNALADLMTRNLIHINRSCLLASAVTNGYGPDPVDGRWEFCDVMFDAATGLRRRYNSMTIAMSSTVIYLTSHMAAALSALPFMERLWVGSNLACLPGDALRSDCIRGRIDFIRDKYKVSFDAFNTMLAHSVDTVTSALLRDGHLAQTTGPQLSAFVEEKSRLLTFLIAKMFGLTRDDSFSLGLEMANNLASLPASQTTLRRALGANQIHPFLENRAQAQGGSVINYFEIRDSSPQFSAQLLALEGVRKARRLTWRHRIEVESLTATALFRGLGAVSYQEGFKASRPPNSPLLAATLHCLINGLTSLLGSESDIRSTYQSKTGAMSEGDARISIEEGLQSSQAWRVSHVKGSQTDSQSCPKSLTGI